MDISGNNGIYNNPTQGDINYTVQLFEKYREIADDDALENFTEEVLSHPAFPEMSLDQKNLLKDHLKIRYLPLNNVIAHLVRRRVELKKALRLYKIIREILLQSEYNVELPETAERIPPPDNILRSIYQNVTETLSPLEQLNIEYALGVPNRPRTVGNQRNNFTVISSTTSNGNSNNNNIVNGIQVPPSGTNNTNNGITYNTGLPSTATTRMYGSEFYGPPGGNTSMNRRNYESEEDYIARIMPELAEGGKRKKQRKTRKPRRKQRKARKSKTHRK